MAVAARVCGNRWDVESLLLACGADIEERAGSRVAIELHDVAIFHRPILEGGGRGPSAEVPGGSGSRGQGSREIRDRATVPSMTTDIFQAK